MRKLWASWGCCTLQTVQVFQWEFASVLYPEDQLWPAVSLPVQPLTRHWRSCLLLSVGHSYQAPHWWLPPAQSAARAAGAMPSTMTIASRTAGSCFFQNLFISFPSKNSGSRLYSFLLVP